MKNYSYYRRSSASRVEAKPSNFENATELRDAQNEQSKRSIKEVSSKAGLFNKKLENETGQAKLKSNSLRKFSKFAGISEDLSNRFMKLAIPENILLKMNYQKKVIKLNRILDLRQLSYVSEEELFDILNILLSKTYDSDEMDNSFESRFKHFIYCGPVLISINPGPYIASPSIMNKKGEYYGHIEKVSSASSNGISDHAFLNLNTWLANQLSKHNKFQKSPHLYTYINNIYQIMLKEKISQAITLQGALGSGKSFLTVHILEALSYIAYKQFEQEGGEHKAVESYPTKGESPKKGLRSQTPTYSPLRNFDVIHRAYQLIHIISSVFRNENMESTCSSINIKLGFDRKSGKQTNLDIDACLIDMTLPFSENGRTYCILHALITGSSSSVKKNLNLPENCDNLNFFKKFNTLFNSTTKEKFKLNDYEVYTKFNSLLIQFKLSKIEIASIMKLLSFILICNDLSIGKREVVINPDEYAKVKNKGTEKFINIEYYRENNLSHYYEYSLIRCNATKQAASCLDISETELISSFGIFHSIEDIKVGIISSMKYTYSIIFEFIVSKIRDYLKIYSYCMANGNDLESYYYKSEKEKAKALDGKPIGISESYSKRNLLSSSKEGSKRDSILESKTYSLLKENISIAKITSSLNSLGDAFIYIVDSPGGLKCQTLGGFATNVFNECISLYSSEEYHCVIENLQEENLELKRHSQLNCYSIVSSCIGQNGLFKFLNVSDTRDISHSVKNPKQLSSQKSKPIDLNISSNLSNLLKLNKGNAAFDKIVSFNSLDIRNENAFKMKFSFNEVNYDFKNLSLETKTLIANQNTINLFKASRNIITYDVLNSKGVGLDINNNNLLVTNQTLQIPGAPKTTNTQSDVNPSDGFYFETSSFYELFLYKSNRILFPIKGLKNYVIYTLHSNNSVQSFFDNKLCQVKENANRNRSSGAKKRSTKLSNQASRSNSTHQTYVTHQSNRCAETVNSNPNNALNEARHLNFYNIPHTLTKTFLSNSLIYPILKWRWFGYHDWIEINSFVNMFFSDFNEAKNIILNQNQLYKGFSDINILSLIPKQKAEFILQTLTSINYYLIGEKFVLLKKNHIKVIKSNLESLLSASNRKKSTVANAGKSKSILDTGLSSSGSVRRIGERKKTNSKSKPKGLTTKRKSDIVDYLLEGFNRNQCEINFLKGNSSLGNTINPNSNTQSQNHESNFVLSSKFSIYSLLKDGANSKVVLPGLTSKIEVLKEASSHTSTEITFTGAQDCTDIPYRAIVKKKAQYNQKLKEMKGQNQQSNLKRLSKPSGFAAVANPDSKMSTEGKAQQNIEEPKSPRELVNPLKKYNIIEPTKNNLHVIKSLFEFSKQNKYNIFDYNDNLSEIQFIQRVVRGYITRKRVASFNYALYCISLIQKVLRGFFTRRKFGKFIVILKKILLIQRLYKKRLDVRIKSIIKMQTLFRFYKAKCKLEEKRNKRRMKIMIYLEETGQIQNVNDLDNWENLDLRQYTYPSDLEISGDSEINNKLDNELQSISMKESAISNSLKPNKSLSKIQASNIQLMNQLQGASKQKIVNVMMNDMKKTIKEKYSNGIASVAIKQKKSNNKIIQKSSKIYSQDELVMLGLSTTQRDNPQGERVEDRLIKYGCELNIKKTQSTFDFLNEQFKEFTYHPKIHALNKSIASSMKLPVHSFLDRIELYKELKSQAIESARERMKYPEEREEETFKPKILPSASAMQRQTDDLYKWKANRDKKVQSKKQALEDEERLKVKIEQEKLKGIQEMSREKSKSIIYNKIASKVDSRRQKDFDMADYYEMNDAYTKEFEINNNKLQGQGLYDFDHLDNNNVSNQNQEEGHGQIELWPKKVYTQNFI